jgi:phage-related protein
MPRKADIVRDLIFERGSRCNIGYALRCNGQTEAKEYIENLNDTIQASFAALFRRIKEGEILTQERFRKLQDSDDIFEFKHRKGHRIPTFKYKGTWWLTHGFLKKGQKTPKTQIRRAEQIKKEHMSLFK